MIHWNAEPLWMTFEEAAVDVSTMQAYPLQGPMPMTPQALWQQRKRLNRARRYLEKSERPGPNRWALSKARQYLGLDPGMDIDPRGKTRTTPR